jgi:Asp-tRNA(Asn)/Glu-tRNA(Gln) amidotransferase A subunit family amidase
VTSTDLCFTSAVDLGALVRTGRLSPVELCEAALTRVERLNRRLNAFLTITPDLARAQARAAEARARTGALRGPLDGIPYTLKDLEPTAEVRTTFGSKWFANYVPPESGLVATRLAAAGGVLLGKTNTPQFGHKDSCDNLLGPPCRNPWRLDRTSGGSSGGAASAVAAGLGPVAHGTDGGGSVRIPAALCGVVGMKPSFGRVPQYPAADYWSARNHQGVLARTVRDAALFLDAMAGPDPRDPLSVDGPPVRHVEACEGDLRGVTVVGALTSATPRWIPRSAASRQRPRSGSPTWALGSRRAIPAGPTPGRFTSCCATWPTRLGTASARCNGRSGSSPA